ncbi:MAG: amidase [Acidobacteriota bacterium]
MARIALVNGEIKALIDEPDRRARIERRLRDIEARWPTASSRPRLYGVPTGVKDLFHVAGLDTRAGSKLPPKAFPVEQGTLVSRLEDAGAIVLAKTTTDELGYALGPATRNPHDLTRTPGGSSAGSAAGVAAGMFPLALGTQTTRSVICPAAFCGVIGFKPSHGRMPLDGVVCLSPSMDTPGLLTQDLPGMALAASVLVDGWTRGIRNSPPVLGIPTGAYLDGLPLLGWRAPFDAAVERLARSGLEVREASLPWDHELEQVYEAAMKLLRGEMALEHGARYEDHGELYDPITRAGIEEGRKVAASDLVLARRLGRRLRDDLARSMTEAGVDLLVSPSQPGPPPLAGGRTGYGATTTPWSFAGLPCLSLPADLGDDLPAGLQLIAPYGRDEALLSQAEPVARALAT